MDDTACEAGPTTAVAARAAPTWAQRLPVAPAPHPPGLLLRCSCAYPCLVWHVPLPSTASIILRVGSYNVQMGALAGHSCLAHMAASAGRPREGSTGGWNAQTTGGRSGDVLGQKRNQRHGVFWVCGGSLMACCEGAAWLFLSLAHADWVAEGRSARNGSQAPTGWVEGWRLWGGSQRHTDARVMTWGGSLHCVACGAQKDGTKA